jgi:hypothetical protein
MEIINCKHQSQAHFIRATCYANVKCYFTELLHIGDLRGHAVA